MFGFLWKQKAETETWTQTVYLSRNTSKEEWESMVAKSMFGVHEGPIPTGTSENINYLPYLSTFIRGGTRTFVHWHSSYSVRIYFSNFMLRNVTTYTLFGQGAVIIDCNWLRLEFPLLRLQDFMYKMQASIQQNTATIFKSLVLSMGEKCSYQGSGWSEGGGHIRESG